MIIGIPKEVKADEYRVGMTPAGVEMLAGRGHQVLVEGSAGLGSGLADEEYEKAGAKIVPAVEDLWAEATMIIKVKEPQPEELDRIRPKHVVFTYFHFAASRELTERFQASGATAVAYETIRDSRGRLPLLTPMSEIAGKMSVQEAAKYLEKPMMGRGVLLGGVPGVPPAYVVVLGGGVVGYMAAKVAAGLGANVAIFDVDLFRLRYLADIMPANVVTLYSSPYAIREQLRLADAVIGAVLIPGAVAPSLVRAEDLKLMQPGAVIVDVAVDQGGCIETTRPTTHGEPTYVIDDIVHYAVTNMPGAVGRTSTFALTNATLPYALKLADMGVDAAGRQDPGLAEGVNIADGKIHCKAVAEAFGIN